MTNAGREIILLQTLVTVDEVEYKLHAFVPSKAFKLGSRVSKFLAEPVVSMATGAGDSEKSIEIIPIAIRALMANLHEDEIWNLIKDLMTCVSVDSQDINIDLYFRGRLATMFKVIAKVIEYQFQDLFTLAAQAIKGVLEKIK